MNGQFQVAQASVTGNSNNSTPPRIFKLTKPLTDQSVVINLGYEQKVQVDFSAIANEKITLVHIGEKLIILFDNQSTVTVEPFFDSRHDALGNLTIEVPAGRTGPAGSGQGPFTFKVFDTEAFAASFTVTADPSVQFSVTYALTINNATTNLIDSVSGQVVHLVPNGTGEVDGVVTINNIQ